MGICINSFSKILDWRPPNDWLEIKTIDLHTEGEPLRMIIKGYPTLQGKTILEKSRAFEIDKKIIPIKEIINLIKND